MNKEQIELYQLKKKDLTEEDKIYISGFKAALDFMDIIKSNKFDETFKMENETGYPVRRFIDISYEMFTEKMIERLFYEIDQASAMDEFDLNHIPDADDYDLNDEEIEDLDFDLPDLPIVKGLDVEDEE